jgi:uracil-DNA glycosylase
VSEPYLSLCQDYESAGYTGDAFRVEWGPIFHRGRLDGSARLLAIGQDPATEEDVARRILVGAAGHRVQGFMAKLGITRSYVILNTFLFSVYSQQHGEQNKNKASIIAYRNRWLAAVLAPGKVQAVVAFGDLADDAWKKFVGGPGKAHEALAFQHVPHPTASSHGDAVTVTKAMLAKWNAAIAAIAPVIAQDAPPQGAPYGSDFQPSELPPIPAADLPAGLPPWMRSGGGWAARVGDTPDVKRRTLHVVVPDGNL